jgi:hypothetical protein
MEKQSIKAEILCDSIERVGNNRITTFKLTYPRMIHSELLTHAMLKSNSASSRAIPFKKMVEMVEQDPFIPIKWMKEHKGMQGDDFLNEEESVDCIKRWLEARDNAIIEAKKLNSRVVTKQICNRLLEPFMWHTIICTGTEFENFFALRAHPMAEIHLQDLAYKMLDAMNNSTPKELAPGGWHIPHLEQIETEEFGKFLIQENEKENVTDFSYNTLLKWEDSKKIKISTAISAQISYLKFGSTDYEDLIDLHDSLVIRPYEGKRGIRTIQDPIHASPASHCAQAMTEDEYFHYVKGNNKDFPKEMYGWCHNLRGFKSYRSMLPNENSTDSRLIKK